MYVETSVISYLTAWASRDVVVAGHQQVTHDWWKSSQDGFEVLASELVVQEASVGDRDAAQDRLVVLNTQTLLEITESSRDLARELVIAAAIPAKAAEDALHLAIAATNGVEYLATWNCRHLANATMRERIETVCRDAGYQPPIICTPEELLEVNSDE